MARTFGLVAAVGAVLALAVPAFAAAPNYILVSGKGIAKPILLRNWRENQALETSFANGRPAGKRVVAGLAHRPRLDLAEFWGWGPPSPVPTRPSEANQHAAFYPVHNDAPAVLVGVFNGARTALIVPSAALRILSRHHVPTTR